MYKAEIGRWVRDRLGRTPGALKLPATGLDIFVVPGFLDAAECEALIGMIDVGRQPSQLLADHPDPEFRTSESCNLDSRNRTVRAIEAKITGLIGIQPAHGETIQGQRYAVGQQFKPHHDFFFTSEPYWPAQEKNGGQRTWTAMVFLNEPEAGGQTFFPKAGIKVAPRRGNLLAWNNLDPAGEPNDLSVHQGMPVEAGVKYVITKWYRERPWS
jgi:prolyl 4-hydroxylase